jgi:predicted membrane GTPase involved in stress response
MIVGENARAGRFASQTHARRKHLTNMRSQGEGKGIQLERRSE